MWYQWPATSPICSDSLAAGLANAIAFIHFFVPFFTLMAIAVVTLLNFSWHFMLIYHFHDIRFVDETPRRFFGMLSWAAGQEAILAAVYWLTSTGYGFCYRAQVGLTTDSLRILPSRPYFTHPGSPASSAPSVLAVGFQFA